MKIKYSTQIELALLIAFGIAAGAAWLILHVLP